MATGRRVKRVVEGLVPPGTYRALWSGEDESGRRVAAGVYFVRLQAEHFGATVKVVLLR